MRSSAICGLTLHRCGVEIEACEIGVTCSTHKNMMHLVQSLNLMVRYHSLGDLDADRRRI